MDWELLVLFAGLFVIGGLLSEMQPNIGVAPREETTSFQHETFRHELSQVCINDRF